MRGILEPTDANEISDRKDKETHEFVTKSSLFAGESFQLNEAEFAAANCHLEEMDKVGENEANKFVSVKLCLNPSGGRV